MTFWRDPVTGITHLTRLTDGRVMCQLCMDFKTRDRLQPVAGEPGRVWDVCQTCAANENATAARLGKALPY